MLRAIHPPNRKKEMTLRRPGDIGATAVYWLPGGPRTDWLGNKKTRTGNEFHAGSKGTNQSMKRTKANGLIVAARPRVKGVKSLGATSST